MSRRAAAGPAGQPGGEPPGGPAACPHDTATDLTGIRDVDAVLKAIVRGTRSLIGSDVAYLSLNDYDSGSPMSG
jgi:hypothetical protein